MHEIYFVKNKSAMAKKKKQLSPCFLAKKTSEQTFQTYEK